MKKAILLIAAATATATAACAAGGAGITGRWVQSSTKTELVLKSKIKLTPSYTPGMGTSLGGTVGYGSPTTTVVVTEPTPVSVTRDMELEVQPNGQFQWSIIRKWMEGQCARTLHQVKRGIVTLSADTLKFSTIGGTEISRDSCGKDARTEIEPLREDFRLTKSAGTLKLTGPTTEWLFKSV